jgi:hypothetical protein
VPEGSVGVALGQIGITATDLSLDKVAGTRTGDSEKNGDTRSSESGFNDQLFSTNTNTVIILASMDQQPVTDESGLNSDASLTSDRHTIDTEPDARLFKRESTSFLASVVNENIAMKTNVDKHGSTIGDRPIGIADFNVSADLPVPGGEGTIAEFDVLNAERLSLVSLQPLPGLVGQRNGLVGVPPLFDAASGLGEGQNQDNHSTLQHESSVNSSSATLSRHRWLVKKCGRIYRVRVQ